MTVILYKLFITLKYAATACYCRFMTSETNTFFIDDNAYFYLSIPPHDKYVPRIITSLATET